MRKQNSQLFWADPSVLAEGRELSCSFQQVGEGVGRVHSIRELMLELFLTQNILQVLDVGRVVRVARDNGVNDEVWGGVGASTKRSHLEVSK